MIDQGNTYSDRYGRVYLPKGYPLTTTSIPTISPEPTSAVPAEIKPSVWYEVVGDSDWLQILPNLKQEKTNNES